MILNLLWKHLLDTCHQVNQNSYIKAKHSQKWKCPTKQTKMSHKQKARNKENKGGISSKPNRSSRLWPSLRDQSQVPMWLCSWHTSFQNRHQPQFHEIADTEEKRKKRKGWVVPRLTQTLPLNQKYIQSGNGKGKKYLPPKKYPPPPHHHNQPPLLNQLKSNLKF